MAQRAWHVVAVLLTLLTAVFFLWRERLSRWGAEDIEVIRELPGDHLGVSRVQRTRAITIAAPPEQVWPWVAQLGRDRAGFYGFGPLEYLLEDRREPCNRIHAEWQEWKPSDALWLYPPQNGFRATGAALRLVRPGEALVVATAANGEDDATYAFILEPTSDHGTRLIVRDRLVGDLSLMQSAFEPLIYDPIRFVMERKMMESIKQRAEGRAATPTRDSVAALGWMLTAQAFCAAMILAVRARTARAGLVAMSLIGVALIAITFFQPGALASLLLGTGAIAGLLVPVVRIRTLAVAEESSAEPSVT